MRQPVFHTLDLEQGRAHMAALRPFPQYDSDGVSGSIRLELALGGVGEGRPASRGAGGTNIMFVLADGTVAARPEPQEHNDHQAPITVHLAVLLANRVARIERTSQCRLAAMGIASCAPAPGTQNQSDKV